MQEFKWLKLLPLAGRQVGRRVCVICGYEMKRILIDLVKCNGCRDCELACISKQAGTLRLLKRQPDGQLQHPSIKLGKKTTPDSRIFIERLAIRDSRSKSHKPTSKIYLPWFCLHCDDAPCLEACISGAMRRDEKTSFIYVDQEQCVGCWSCMMVCPFGVIQRGQHVRPPLKELPRPEDSVSEGDGTKEFALKCDGCPDLAEPPCVSFCEPKALVFSTPFIRTRSTQREAVRRYSVAVEQRRIVVKRRFLKLNYKSV